MEDFKANYYDMLHWDQQQELDGRIKQAQSARRRNQQWRNDQERARIEKEAAESRAYEVRASAHAEACRRLNEQETAKKVEHEEAKRLARRKLLWLY
jgi:membrane protein involved in colicin uptake